LVIVLVVVIVAPRKAWEGEKQNQDQEQPGTVFRLSSSHHLIRAQIVSAPIYWAEGLNASAGRLRIPDDQ
jgi:hypothetical protein